MMPEALGWICPYLGRDSGGGALPLPSLVSSWSNTGILLPVRVSYNDHTRKMFAEYLPQCLGEV